jgi:superfamily II DNA or RNA helicase
MSNIFSFNIGDRVTIIDRNKNGKIESKFDYNGIQYFYIVLDNGDNTTTTRASIKPEVEKIDPFKMILQSTFKSKSIYLVSSIINKMSSKNNDIIATLKASKTNFLPYQFKPLSKFIKSDNRRLLIADEVGLGKTIEAGYILAELILRGQINNCIIICKSSLKEKWKIELDEKFSLKFKILNRKELINSINEDVDVGVKSLLGIINYDYNEKGSNELINILNEKGYNFDMVIVDEAHILRNPSTIKHKAISKIIYHSTNSILLTATPIMTAQKNLYSLVKIIEPKYESYLYGNIDFGYGLFLDHIELSKPFIKALNNFNTGLDHKKIINELVNSEINLNTIINDEVNIQNKIIIKDRFKNDPLFNSLVEYMKKENLTYSEMAVFQKTLSDLNSFQNIISRTRKREVLSLSKNAIRKAEKISIDFEKIEKEIYDEIINDYEGYPLALVTKKRQATSSLPAFIKNHPIYQNQYEEIYEVDSKFKKLSTIINKIFDETNQENKKIIIFSFFKGTLSYLEEKLEKKGIITIKIDGDTPIEERQNKINKFKNEKRIKILLSSEVGSEGLDMQFCDVIINYDLPWNPMVVEQRIGRIDRIGQKSNIIYIYNLCILETIEDQIFDRLLARINIFKETIGGLEDILTSELTLFENDGLESQIYGYKLSKKAIDEKIKQAEIAIENSILLKKEIELNLNESFLNEQYINDEIENINIQNKYITEEDSKKILELFFQTRLSSIRGDFESEKKYIRWSQNQTDLFDAINENIPERKNNPLLYNSNLLFRNKYINKTSLDITFNQKEAYENQELEYISASHPLTQAALFHFNKKNLSKNNAYFFCINNADLPEKLPKNTLYSSAKMLFTINKTTISGDEIQTKIIDLVFFINQNGKFEILNELQTSEFLNISQDHWFVDINMNPELENCKAIVETLKPIYTIEAFTKKNKLEEEYKITHISKQNRIIDTEIDFLERQIIKDGELLEKNIDNSIKYIYTKRINDYKNKIIELNIQKTKIKLELTDTLESITLIAAI